MISWYIEHSLPARFRTDSIGTYLAHVPDTPRCFHPPLEGSTGCDDITGLQLIIKKMLPPTLQHRPQPAALTPIVSLTHALADGLQRSRKGPGVPLDPQPKPDLPRPLQTLMVHHWEKHKQHSTAEPNSKHPRFRLKTSTHGDSCQSHLVDGLPVTPKQTWNMISI